MREIFSVLLIVCFVFSGITQPKTFYVHDQLNTSWKRSQSFLMETEQSYLSIYKIWQGPQEGHKLVYYNDTGTIINNYSLKFLFTDVSLSDMSVTPNTKNIVLNGVGVGSNGWVSFSGIYDQYSNEISLFQDSIYFTKSRFISDSVFISKIKNTKPFRSMPIGTHLGKFDTKSFHIINSYPDSTLLASNSPFDVFDFGIHSVAFNPSQIGILAKKENKDVFFIKHIDYNFGVISQSDTFSLKSVTYFGGDDNYFLVKYLHDGVGNTAIIKMFSVSTNSIITEYKYENSYVDVNSIIQLSKKNLVLLTPYDSNYNRKESYLLWFNDSGKVVRSCNYNFNEGSFVMNNLKMTKDNGFILTVNNLQSSNYKVGMLKTDSLGLVYNTDVICDCKDFNVGVEPKLKVFSPEDVKIFPNPARSKLNVLLTHQKEGVIEVMGTNGQTYLSQNTAFNSNILDVSSLTTGLYFVRVKTQENTIIKKFVVAR